VQGVDLWGLLFLLPVKMFENLGISGNFKDQARRLVCYCCHTRGCDIFTVLTSACCWSGYTRTHGNEQKCTLAGRVA